MYLDVRGCLISYDIVAGGGLDSAPFDVRRIILKAIGRGCSGLMWRTIILQAIRDQVEQIS